MTTENEGWILFRREDQQNLRHQDKKEIINTGGIRKD